ncbi:hypothetical protein QO010_001990 [Caulobacter ginsengisoli]|uniref:Restriction endonuclease n=1 Tax=Caulobacter ginsengisoli TaxID=400775 RepID=A0ABU0IQH1_9CAUL|nr:hypothetical protein [Caulobacter ginsengisoli]MDQ0464209.1 hypothetical protein [Caulobacter ginsengisoli]
MDEWRYRVLLEQLPPLVGDGGAFYTVPLGYAQRAHELAATVAFISNRPLFGEVYRQLEWAFFRQMPQKSGLLLGLVVPTNQIVPGATNPGDIDLLIIPYEEDELVLERTMAIEIKVIRASYLRQGKSPNEFGFTQGQALLALGFPYAGVAHLIVADESPAEAWREVGQYRVAQEDRLEDPKRVLADMLPADLIRRGMGRLEANCIDDRLALVSAYVGRSDLTIHEPGVWIPRCRSGQLNAAPNEALLDSVARFYHRNRDRMLDTPRYDRLGTGL